MLTADFRLAPVLSITVETSNQLFYFLINLWAFSDINCWSRCGSSPSHWGFEAVPSKIDEVLNGSNSPLEAAPAVFANNDSFSCSLRGWNVRSASKA